MKAVVAAFNQEKALVGAFSVIVQPVLEPMDHFTALIINPSDNVESGTKDQRLVSGGSVLIRKLLSLANS